MATESYDLLVIGAGPGGSSAASAAAERGVRVAQVERDRLGGTCHNYGCDPTKTLLHVAHLLHQARQAERYGLQIPRAEADWAAVQRRVREVLQEIEGGTEEQARQQVKDSGIDLIIGEASFVSPHELQVGDRTVRAERIILAPGTRAVAPEVDGLEQAGYITNVEAVSLPQLPRRLAVIGSGPLGVEFAQMFCRFGVEVTVLERNDMLLDGEDRVLAEQLCGLLQDEGIRMEINVDLQRVERTENGKRLTMRCGDREQETIVVDEILVAAGRAPQLEALKLDRAGVKTHKKGIEVDQMLRTSAAHIWAIGDVATPYQFTHVASDQGQLATSNALGDDPQPFDSRAIPWVTYTSPELAHIGMTEEELQQEGRRYQVASASLEENERAIAIGKPVGQVRLLVGEDGTILGGHILAPQAGEMIAPVVLAMQAGLTAAQLGEAILPYPTLTASVRRAAQSL